RALAGERVAHRRDRDAGLSGDLANRRPHGNAMIAQNVLRVKPRRPGGVAQRLSRGVHLFDLPAKRPIRYAAEGVCALLERHADREAREGVKHESPGSVEELQLETRVMCSPGLEVELELAAPLALATSVGDDDLDHIIVDLVGNPTPAVEEVP